MTLQAESELDLRVDEADWHQVDRLADVTKGAFNSALRCIDMQPAGVGATIVLSDNQTVQALNNQWRDKHQPTNILSFPAPCGEKTETGQRYLGDMILAYGVVKLESEQQGKALATHLCHLVIHGALHLLGHDHQNDDEARKMEDLERTAMMALELPDPYLPFLPLENCREKAQS